MENVKELNSNEIYEEERTAENKKLEKAARKQAKEQARQKKLYDFKRRVRKAQGKAKRIGWWYLLFSLLFAAAAFLPLFVSSSGTVSVLTFWKVFLNVKHVKGNIAPVVVGLLGSVLYAFILLSVVFNFFKSLGSLRKLHKKRPSRQNGYNRNAQAMVRLGKLFSGTLISLVLFGYLMRIFADVQFTTLFWIVLALGVLVHFWLGLRSGGVSYFPVGKKQEIKRMGGKFAPFMRNLFQLVVVSLMMLYFLDVNLISNLFKLLQKDVFKTLFDENVNLFVYIVLPALHFLMLIWIIALFNHAVRPNEFHHDGKRAPGRMTFRTVSFFLLLTSAGAFAVTYLVSQEATAKGFGMSFGTLYIAALALAAFIEELSMRKLPNDKDNCVVSFEQQETQAPCPFVPPQPSYHVPLTCVTEPGVFMQPNGQPVMVMPMIAGPKQAPVMAVPSYEYTYQNPHNTFATPYGENKTYDPYHAEIPKEGDADKVEGIGLSRAQLHNEAMREMNIAQLTDKWVNMAKNPPLLEGETQANENFAAGNPYFSKLKEVKEEPAEEPKKPAKGKSWTVSCPDCGAKVLVHEGSYAYRCPDCDCVFQLRKKN